MHGRFLKKEQTIVWIWDWGGSGENIDELLDLGNVSYI